MNNKLSSLRNFFPSKSLFGFKILSSWHSVLTCYYFILCEYFLTPFFGIETEEVVAGLFFILLINFSIIILILNSLIRFNKNNLLLCMLIIPLVIYTPVSLNKIFLNLSYLVSYISR